MNPQNVLAISCGAKRSAASPVGRPRASLGCPCSDLQDKTEVAVVVAARLVDLPLSPNGGIDIEFASSRDGVSERQLEAAVMCAFGNRA